MKERRRFSWPCFLLVLAVWMPGVVTAQTLRYTGEAVVDGVRLFRPNDPGVGNCVAIVGETDVVMIDTGATPSAGRDIVRQLRDHTAAPVRVVITTHWHDDHVWGNQAFAAAFPCVEFLAHRNTREDMLELAVPAIAENVTRLREKITAREAMLARGQDADGAPLDEKERLRLGTRQEMFRGVLRDFESIVPTPPTLLVENDVELLRGGRRIRVLCLGRGNTRGDLAVHLPGEGLLVTGDLLTHPVPVAAGAHVSEWLSCLRALNELDFDVMIPGHGPVQRDRAYLRQVIALVEALLAQVRIQVAEGRSLDETKQAIHLAEHRDRFAGEDARLRFAFEQFFRTPAIESAYAELTASFEPRESRAP